MNRRRDCSTVWAAKSRSEKRRNRAPPSFNVSRIEDDNDSVAINIGKNSEQKTFVLRKDALVAASEVFSAAMHGDYVVPSLALFCWKKFMILFRPISFVFESYRPSLAFLEILDQSIICKLGE
jgi:hypothetical protein